MTNGERIRAAMQAVAEERPKSVKFEVELHDGTVMTFQIPTKGGDISAHEKARDAWANDLLKNCPPNWKEEGLITPGMDVAPLHMAYSIAMLSEDGITQHDCLTWLRDMPYQFIEIGKALQTRILEVMAIGGHALNRSITEKKSGTTSGDEPLPELP